MPGRFSSCAPINHTDDHPAGLQATRIKETPSHSRDWQHLLAVDLNHFEQLPADKRQQIPPGPRAPPGGIRKARAGRRSADSRGPRSPNSAALFICYQAGSLQHDGVRIVKPRDGISLVRDFMKAMRALRVGSWAEVTATWTIRQAFLYLGKEAWASLLFVQQRAERFRKKDIGASIAVEVGGQVSHSPKPIETHRLAAMRTLGAMAGLVLLGVQFLSPLPTAAFPFRLLFSGAG